MIDQLIGQQFKQPLDWTLTLGISTVVSLASREADGDDYYLCRCGSKEYIDSASEIRRLKALYGEVKEGLEKE